MTISEVLQKWTEAILGGLIWGAVFCLLWVAGMLRKSGRAVRWKEFRRADPS